VAVTIVSAAFALAALTAIIQKAAAGEDAPKAGAGAPAHLPTLSDEQRSAVGIALGHPVSTASPDRIDALGSVLDVAQLIAEEGELRANTAARDYAAAEVARLKGLYQGGAAASQKALQSAEAELAKAQSLSRSAQAQFKLHWGPLATMGAEQRRGLMEGVEAGRALLIRADLLGRHSLGEIPQKALLQVDGIQLPGRVLGVLSQSNELQSVGLLIELRNPPTGLGAGARVPLFLLGSGQRGVLVPREALLYDEHGAYVYQPLKRKPGEKLTRFAAVRVHLLSQVGEGWLVSGVDGDDDIVVRGAGVLWSLEQLGDHAADSDDD
jgi:hypothetical protein